jgi:hypothetical protein
MPLQYITDNTGAHTAVVIPINEWEKLTRKHEDLKTLEAAPTKPKVKLSDYEGKLSHETAEAMLNYVAESRKGWGKRLKKQL